MKRIVFLLATALSLTACDKSEIPVANGSLSAKATIDVRTKVDYTDNGAEKGVKVDWSDTESFKAYYGEDLNDSLIFSKSEAGTSFIAKNVPAEVGSETKFSGLYGEKASLDSNGKIKIDFTEQGGTLAGLSAFDVMTADSELKDDLLSFAFKHKCAVLRLKCENHYETEIGKVRLKFFNARISDEFSETGIINDGDYLTLEFKLTAPVANVNSVQEKEKYRFAIVPAMSYSGAQSSTPATSTSNEVFDREIHLENGRSIQAGKVYDVTVTQKAPSNGLDNGKPILTPQSNK